MDTQAQRRKRAAVPWWLVFGVLVLIVCLAIGSVGPVRAGHCGAPPDPRSNRGGYADWCGCMEGRVDYSAGVGCRDPKHGMSPGGGEVPIERRRSPPVAAPAADGTADQYRRELEARHARERQQERDAARDGKKNTQGQARGQKAFDKAKAHAESILKGTGAGRGGVKMPGDGLVPAAGTPTFGIKGNPTAALGLKGSGSGTVSRNSRFSRGTKYSAPVVTDLNQVQSGTRKELDSANRKTELLLDALQAARGSWNKALTFLGDWVKKHPNDADARQALEYLRGFRQGWLNAERASDEYFRFGARLWVDGNYYSAARAFGRSLANSPFDHELVQTFAFAAGMAEESPTCKRRPKQCPIIDEHTNFGTDDSAYADRLAALETKVRRNPKDLKSLLRLQYMKGILIYAERPPAALAIKSKPYDDEDRKLRDAWWDRLAAGDYAGAAEKYRTFHDRHLAKHGDAVKPFLLASRAHALGRATMHNGRAGLLPPGSRAERAVTEIEDEFWNQATRQLLATADKQRQRGPADAIRALLDTTKRNPFFGRLAKSRVAQLLGKARDQ